MKTTYASLFLASLFVAASGALGGVREDLVALQSRCLWFAAGKIPSGTNTVHRHGLYAQSPFSPPGEVDLAASGFGLAGLPAAVENGVIAGGTACAVALAASERVLEMVTKSSSATTAEQRQRYGYGGMLYHYCTWSDAGGEFRGNPGTEVSSADTVLLLYGLAVCGAYFQGTVYSNSVAAREKINWRAWVDTAPGHSNQVRMAWNPNSGFVGWWDWRTDETSLICLMAAASDTNLDAVGLWNAWNRPLASYTRGSQVFSCVPSWYGDPFTDFYGLHFLDTKSLGRDINGVDWFANSRTSYFGHVAFFTQERGYLDSLTTAFVASELNGVIARPSGDSGAPVGRSDAAIYSVAGGLPFYSPNPVSNTMAIALSHLAMTTPSFYQWHGWPVESVNATMPSHPVKSPNVVGQDVASIALSIDNYLTGRAYTLLRSDAKLQRVLRQIFPTLQFASVTPSTNIVFLSAVGSQNFTAALTNGRNRRVQWTWTFDGGNVLSTSEVAQSTLTIGATPELVGPHAVHVEVADASNPTISRDWLLVVGEGDPDLLLHWTFDADGRDWSGWGNDITIGNDAALIWDGVSGRAVDFTPP